MNKVKRFWGLYMDQMVTNSGGAALYIDFCPPRFDTETRQPFSSERVQLGRTLEVAFPFCLNMAALAALAVDEVRGFSRTNAAMVHRRVGALQAHRHRQPHRLVN